MNNIFSETLRLPCGHVVPNRICKAAMSENMAEPDGRPSKELKQLYRVWSDSGAGILLSGNVMVDAKALGEPFNVVVEDETFLGDLTELASIAQSKGAQLFMQINHPGRQVMKSLGNDVVAPSAIPLKQKFLFASPRALESDEVEKIIDRYVATALVAKKAGFKGVQIHGAHGYLVSQFLSPLVNKRSDKWGGSLENRARFLIEIIKGCRKELGANYPISVKINSADFQRGAFTEEESLEVLVLLENASVDLIEISGGTYEKAAMMGVNQRKSTEKREAYFAEYIVKARKKTSVPLILTGGFRTASAMAAALENKELDMIGLARPFTIYPKAGKELLEGTRESFLLKSVSTGVSYLDRMGAVDLVWHSLQMRRLGKGQDPDPKMSAWKPLWHLVKTASGA